MPDDTDTISDATSYCADPGCGITFTHDCRESEHLANNAGPYAATDHNDPDPD